jgi:cytochrome b involved in lipid metabolism
MNQFFDTMGGLPLHPLAVHAAAVLIPLSAIALAVLVFVPKWRKAYLPLTVGALGVSVVLAFVATESGEALAKRVGNPGEHQALGDMLLPASVGLFALGVAFFIFSKSTKPKWVLQLAGALSTVAVVGVVVLSVLVGHSGAEATWANRIAATKAQELPTTSPTPGDATGAGITAAEVQKHNTAKDCWTVINKNVYDLTSYIARHPGGESVLTAICGKDGTNAFTGQHSGEPKPKADLSSLLVGPLVSSSASTGTTPKAKTFTAAEVLKHNIGTDCWSVINGKVYDLTSYVNSHPGGANLIKAICGKDGSAAFAGQHGSASKPNNILAGFALGALVSGGTLPESPAGGNGEEEEEEEEGDDN